MGWGKVISGVKDVIGVGRDVRDLVGPMQPAPSSNVPDAGGGAVTTNAPSWVPWATMPPTDTPGDVFRVAQAHDASYEVVGRLVVPRAADDGGIAYWAYLKNNRWRIPAQRLGQDRLALDHAVEAGDIDPTSVTDGVGTGVGYPGGGGVPAPSGNGNSGAILGFQFGRVRPRIINTRRCPGGMRLAKDGWCYPTRMLPAAARQNQVKRAVVTWSEGQAIRKGRAAAKRIKKINQTNAKEARALIPRRRSK